MVVYGENLMLCSEGVVVCSEGEVLCLKMLLLAILICLTISLIFLRRLKTLVETQKLVLLTFEKVDGMAA